MRFDDRAHHRIVVRGEIIDRDDLARAQGRTQALLDERSKGALVDRHQHAQGVLDARGGEGGDQRVNLRTVDIRRGLPSDVAHGGVRASGM